MSADLLETAFAALDRAALAVLIGLCACWLWLETGRNKDLCESAPGIGRLLAISLITLAVTAIADLVLRTATLAQVDISEAWNIVPKVVTQSAYGQFWLLRGAALVAVAGLWWLRRSPPLEGVRGIGALAALLIAFTVSSTGHAGEDGGLTVLNMVNTLHIAAGCLWGGTVVAYALTVLPHLQRTHAAAAISETAVRLSTLAGAALAVVLATGLYNAWIQVETLTALITTEYGWILLIKLSFVAIMAGVGALNRFFVVPSIEAWARPPRLSPTADGPTRTFLNRLRIDIAVFALILVCAALLGNTTPARHMQHEAALPVLPAQAYSAGRAQPAGAYDG